MTSHCPRCTAAITDERNGPIALVIHPGITPNLWPVHERCVREGELYVIVNRKGKA